MTESALTKYYAALDVGDFTAAAAQWAEDAVYIRGSGGVDVSGFRRVEIVEGREAIGEAFRRRGKTSARHDIHLSEVCGSRAYIEGVASDVPGVDGPGHIVFFGTATLDENGLIARYLPGAVMASTDGLAAIERATV